ncbi:hypothetical protein TNCT_617791 [Trichonephila clavata]|uniref:Uncharacterized protein n=1 Tax=Trichonephila clavata TaxID=2740835 RepID=A0A8X6J9E6_TRICU|nr:hypothetical protein TNCT_617791 [Trichonephila clavata]
MTEAEVLKSLRKSGLSHNDSTNDEDYVWDSTSQSEGDTDVAMGAIETLASENVYINFPGSERVAITDSVDCIVCDYICTKRF